MTAVTSQDSVSSQQMFVLKARYSSMANLASSGNDHEFIDRFDSSNLHRVVFDYYFKLQQADSSAYPSYIIADHYETYINDQVSNLRNMCRQVKFLQRFRLNQRVKSYVKYYLPRSMNYRKKIIQNPTREEKRIFRSASQIIASTVRSVDSWRTSEDATRGLQRIMRCYRDTILFDLQRLTSQLETVRRELGVEEAQRREEEQSSDDEEEVFIYSSTNSDLYGYLTEGKRLKKCDDQIYFTFSEHYFYILTKMENFYLKLSRGDFGDDLKDDILSLISREKLLVYCLLESIQCSSVRKAYRVDPLSMDRKEQTLFQSLFAFEQVQMKERVVEAQQETRALQEKAHEFFDQNVTPSLIVQHPSTLQEDPGEDENGEDENPYFDIYRYTDDKERVIRAYLKDDLDSLSDKEKELLTHLEMMVGRVHFYDVEKTVSRDCENSPKVDFDACFNSETTYQGYDASQREAKLMNILLQKLSKKYVRSEESDLKDAITAFEEVAEESYTEEKDEKLGKIFRSIWTMGHRRQAFSLLKLLEDNGCYKFVTLTTQTLIDIGLGKYVAEMIEHTRSPDQKVFFLKNLALNQYYRRNNAPQLLKLLETYFDLLTISKHRESYQRISSVFNTLSEKEIAKLGRDSAVSFIRLCISFGSHTKVKKLFDEKDSAARESNAVYEKKMFTSVISTALDEIFKLNAFSPAKFSSITQIIKNFPELTQKYVPTLYVKGYEYIENKHFHDAIVQLFQQFHIKELDFEPLELSLKMPIVLIGLLHLTKNKDLVVDYAKTLCDKVDAAISDESIDSTTGKMLSLVPKLHELFQDDEFFRVVTSADFFKTPSDFSAKEGVEEALRFYFSFLGQMFHPQEGFGKMALDYFQKVQNPELKAFLVQGLKKQRLITS